MTLKEIESARKAFEEPLRKLFYRNLMASIEPALKHLPEIVPDAIPKDLIYDAYVKTYQGVGTWFAKETMKEVQKATTVEEDLFKEKMKAYVDNHVGERITDVWDYTKEEYVKKVHEAVSQTLDEGYDPNVSAERLTKKVKANFAEFTQWRALRIARTETIAAANMGSLEGAKVVGDQMVKVWMTFVDGETRPSHVDANGQKREMDEPFDVGGEALMVPGDPAGSAENVINCRCAVGYERKMQ